MEKTISSRQLGLLAFVLTFSLKLTILPSLLFERIQADMFMVVLFSEMIEFGLFMLIFWLLKKNQDISFFQFLSKSLGKIIARIVVLILFVFFFFKLLLILQGGFGYARQVIFQEASLFLFAFIFLVITSSLYLFKSKAAARTIEFFYPIISVMFFVFIAVAFLTAQLQDIRPLLDHDGITFFNTLFSCGIVNGNYLFMLFLMGRIKFDKKSNRQVIGHVLLAQVFLLTFYYVYISTFKYTAIIHPNAISEIVQFLPLPSILGNLDWFAVTLMMMLFTFQGAIFMFCTCEPLNNFFAFGKLKPTKIAPWSLVFINMLSIIFIYVIFKSFEELELFLIKYGAYLGVIVEVLVILFFIIQLVKDSISKRSKKSNKVVKQYEGNA